MSAPCLSCEDPADSITSGRPAAAPIALAFAALLGGSAALGYPQFASGVSLVEVYASVTDAQGQPIEGLTAAEFGVREDGEPQRITNFAAGEFPLAAALAIDRSFSMAGDRLATAKSAARIFLGELRASDQAAILAVGSEVEVVAPLSTDRAAQHAALARLDPFGTTGLHDAIIRAIDLTQGAKGRRALVLLSDGVDRYSTASANGALQHARSADVMIYPVALGARRPPLFAELAALTGGRSFHLADARMLPDTLRTIARELRHQYLLGYTPSRSIAPGANEWRSIAVTVNRPGARVRARDGYLAR